VIAVAVVVAAAAAGRAQAAEPALVDPNLRLTTAVAGLELPTSIALIGANDLFALEKNTGRVLRVTNGVVRGDVLDLSVNNFSERGLLGIALHPNFPTNPGVYLFWSCRSATDLDADPFTPEEHSCSDANMTGLRDSDDVLRVPLLGKPDRSLRLGRLEAHLRPAPDHVALVPERRRADAAGSGRRCERAARTAACARQPRRRRARLRP
jgi:hypothetical protein